MSTPQVSILIISYNTRALTLACLRSVFAQTRGVAFEVILVDNASRDGSREAVAAEFPQVHIAGADRNLGFAAGNNLAAMRASGDYLLLLNPDTEVLDGAIDRLVQFAFTRDTSRGLIVGGRTFRPDGRLDPESCHGKPTLWSVLCDSIGLRKLAPNSPAFNPEALPGWARDTERDVDIVSGCMLLISRKLWNRLGGFDPAFFMYGEDADLCLRAARLGAVSTICPEARIVHHSGASDTVRADKMVKLLRAKAQLFDRHWTPHAASWGRRLLSCSAWSRMVALHALSIVRPARRGAALEWREIWRRRGEYSGETSCDAGESFAASHGPGDIVSVVPGASGEVSVHV